MVKPKKSGCKLNELECENVLPCQQLLQYEMPQISLNIPKEFTVCDRVDMPEMISMKDQVLSLIMSRSQDVNVDVPSWGGMRSLLSEANIPLMQVGFLPFLPHPVTDYQTVYTALKNFVKVCEQLD